MVRVSFNYQCSEQKALFGRHLQIKSRCQSKAIHSEGTFGPPGTEQTLRIIEGIYRDYGKQDGNYYSGFRVCGKKQGVCTHEGPESLCSRLMTDPRAITTLNFSGVFPYTPMSNTKLGYNCNLSSFCISITHESLRPKPSSG